MARRPILLVHGAFSHARHFDGWVRALTKAGFDCHAPSLPGHWPSDACALASLTLSDYLSALRRTAAMLSAPPVVIGQHGWPPRSTIGRDGSMHGARLRCIRPALDADPPVARAVVPDASDSGWSPIRPDEGTLRDLALHDLPEQEQYELVPTFGAESGRAFRAMILGLARIPGRQFRGPVLCLSGSQDRIISNRISNAIVRYYSASRETFPKRGHWLIASSAEDEVVTTIVRWLQKYVVDARPPN